MLRLPLYLQNAIEITPPAPFNFDATLHKPDHFPTPDNAWEPGARWQTMRWQGRPLGLKFAAAGSVDAPRVRLSIWAAEAEFSGPTSEVLRDICATPITPELLPLGAGGVLEQSKPYQM